MTTLMEPTINTFLRTPLTLKKINKPTKKHCEITSVLHLPHQPAIDKLSVFLKAQLGLDEELI